MALPSAPLSRRTLALLTLTTAAASSCSSSVPATPSLPPDPVADPDRELTAAARADEQSAATFVASVAAAHPVLRRRLAGTLAAHRRHVQVFSDGPEATTPSEKPRPTPPPAPPVPDKAPAAVAAVVDVQLLLVRAHARRSQRAASGPLARVLAAAAAASAQQAHVLGGGS